jgi:NAD(P)-dependent dehydrogenase (short-subunit alcohol dehydrogenase family)
VTARASSGAPPVAAVTGSASGIGAAVCARLEAEGARVIGVDLAGADVCADLSTAEGREAAVAGVQAACEGRLDRLALCAGVGSHIEDLARIPSVNYFGAVALLDGLTDALAAGRAPAAVVIGSNSAQYLAFDAGPGAAYVEALLAGDEPGARGHAAAGNGFLAYAGSKHALARAVRRRARDLGARGVRGNVVAPGPVETPLLAGSLRHPIFGRGVDQVEIPLGRRGRPEEIAALVAFLLSAEAGWMHGSVVFLDGGNDAVVRPDRF